MLLPLTGWRMFSYVVSNPRFPPLRPVGRSEQVTGHAWWMRARPSAACEPLRRRSASDLWSHWLQVRGISLLRNLFAQVPGSNLKATLFLTQVSGHAVYQKSTVCMLGVKASYNSQTMRRSVPLLNECIEWILGLWGSLCLQHCVFARQS